MEFSILKKEDIQHYLDQINLVAYSDAFARFVEAAYASQRVFVGIKEGNSLKAFFPAFERTYRGQKTVEMPIFVYSDVFFVDRNFKISADVLGRKLQKLLGADVVRLNLCSLLQESQNLRRTGLDHVFTAMVANLGQARDYEDYLKNVLSKNARSKIYKSYQGGLELVQLARDDLPVFHRFYSEHVSSLGSRPHPLEYFQKMLAAHIPGKDLLMLGGKKDGKLITANLFVTHKDYMEVKFLADEFASRHLFPNNFLYAETIKWAYANGIKRIDFGGIPKTMRTNIDFKKSLGAQEYPIYTKYFFRNPWQELKFKFGRKVLYWKKYRDLEFIKFIKFLKSIK